MENFSGANLHKRVTQGEISIISLNSNLTFSPFGPGLKLMGIVGKPLEGPAISGCPPGMRCAW